MLILTAVTAINMIRIIMKNCNNSPTHSTCYVYNNSLFFWRYNPLWLHFHSPVAGFRFIVFEVSRSHTTTRHIR